MKRCRKHDCGIAGTRRSPSEAEQVLFSWKTLALLVIWVAVLVGMPSLNREYVPEAVPANAAKSGVPEGGTVSQAMPVLSQQSSPDKLLDSSNAAAGELGGTGARPRIGETNLEQQAVRVAKETLATAIQWWENLPDDARKAKMGLTIAYELSRENPEGALTLLAKLPVSKERDEATVYSARQWAARDADAVAQWAFGVPDPVLRSRLVAGVATAVAEVDGPKAARLAAANVEDEQEQSRAVVVVAQEWAQNDRNAAMAWVSEFPESPLKQATEQALDAENVGDGRPGN